MHIIRNQTICIGSTRSIPHTRAIHRRFISIEYQILWSLSRHSLLQCLSPTQSNTVHHSSPVHHSFFRMIDVGEERGVVVVVVVGRGGGGGGGGVWTPYPRGSNPLPPPNIFLPTPTPFFPFFGLPRPQILIFSPTPAHFSSKDPLPP